MYNADLMCQKFQMYFSRASRIAAHTTSGRAPRRMVTLSDAMTAERTAGVPGSCGTSYHDADHNVHVTPASHHTGHRLGHRLSGGSQPLTPGKRCRPRDPDADGTPRSAMKRNRDNREASPRSEGHAQKSQRLLRWADEEGRSLEYTAISKCEYDSLKYKEMMYDEDQKTKKQLDEDIAELHDENMNHLKTIYNLTKSLQDLRQKVKDMEQHMQSMQGMHETYQTHVMGGKKMQEGADGVVLNENEVSHLSDKSSRDIGICIN